MPGAKSGEIGVALRTNSNSLERVWRSLGLFVLLVSCGRGSSLPPLGGESPPVSHGDETSPDQSSDVAYTGNDAAILDDEADPEPFLDPHQTTSIGSPTHGRLQGSVPLPLRGRGFVFDPERDPERRHGTAELVRAIVTAAGRVEDRWPGSTLVVGDLSLPEGGDIEGHGSHRNGRDVDVAFYLLGADGVPRPSKTIPIEPDGSGVDYGDLADGADDDPVRFDAARTWAFVDGFLSESQARVNRIYLVEHVRSLLLHHARSIGADPGVIERFGHLTCQPSFPHDDHMHIRLYCSVQDIDAGCEDTAPVYPWHAEYVASLGRTLRVAKPQASRAKVTSVDQAAKKAQRKYGRFAPEVVAFLERRKGWIRKPSPGRPYCP